MTETHTAVVLLLKLLKYSDVRSTTACIAFPAVTWRPFNVGETSTICLSERRFFDTVLSKRAWHTRIFSDVEYPPHAEENN